jgi:hypothetical protein
LGKNGVWAFYSNICVEGKYNSGSKYTEYGDMNLDGYIDSKGMNVVRYYDRGISSSMDYDNFFYFKNKNIYAME